MIRILARSTLTHFVQCGQNISALILMLKWKKNGYPENNQAIDAEIG